MFPEFHQWGTATSTCLLQKENGELPFVLLQMEACFPWKGKY
jgi:hypothetical protein